MKKCCLFAGLIFIVLIILFAVGAHALPQTLRIPEQQHDSELLVRCGFDVFDPVPVSTMPASPQENQHALSLPASDEPHAAPVTAVPEPSTLGLLGLGVVLGLGLVGLRRRGIRK